MQKVGAGSRGRVSRGSEAHAFKTVLENQPVRAEKVITGGESGTDSQVTPPNLGRNIDVRA